MSITIIVAAGRDGAIGRGGDLAFHISGDLRRFKALTMGHPVIMGRRTYESLPGGALPGRRNIVLTRDAGWCAPGVETAQSLDEALAMTVGTDPFIIGGGSVYEQAMACADRIELTEIDADSADADTWLTAIVPDIWDVAAESEPQTDPRTGLTYRFITYTRR